MISLSDYLDQDVVNVLVGAGLTKQQANSQTAQVCAEVMMPEEGRVLIEASKRKVDEMQRELNRIRDKYDELADTILEIQKAQQEYGVLTDERAKNALALYGAIMALNQKLRVPAEQSAESTGYIVYAYLGGQAKRDITYVEGETK